MRQMTRLTTDIEYISFAKLHPNTKLSGTYIESYIDDKYDRLKYKLQDEQGKTVIVPSSAKLDYLMRTIKPGTYIEITYLGKKPLSSGKHKGSEAHDFELLFDKSSVPIQNELTKTNVQSKEDGWVPF